MMVKYFSSCYAQLRSISALNILLYGLVTHCGQSSAGFFCAAGQRNFRATTKSTRFRQTIPLQMLQQMFPIRSTYCSSSKSNFVSFIPKRAQLDKDPQRHTLSRLSATKKTGLVLCLFNYYLYEILVQYFRDLF